MNNQIESLDIGENEISLIEIWQILIARKWLIMAVPAMTVLIASVYLALAKPEFEYMANILIGQIGRGQLVKNPGVIAKELSEKYRVDDNTAPKVLPRLSSVSFDKNGTGSIVSFKAIDHTPIGAKAYLDEIVKEVLEEEIRLFEQGIQLKLAHLQSLTDQIKAFEAYQLQLEKHIEDVNKLDPAQAAILAVEQGKFLAIMPDLENQKYILQTSMSESESYPTKLIGESRLPEKPFRPKRALVLLLAGMSGLMLGIIAAFLADYIEKVRASCKKKRAPLLTRD
jgi:uncharacterized protein involved in exopolysaccharide biosynthesis